ncbi:MAG: autorepressor SdpR family transcription factor [Bacillota bacterium]
MRKVFFALSDPTRRKILESLNSRDMTAGEIAELFPMSKPSISHHLNVLKEAGLVSCEKRGQHIVYSLETTVFQEVISWIMNLMGRSNGHEANES